jgi:hypothetical protein
VFHINEEGEEGDVNTKGRGDNLIDICCLLKTIVTNFLNDIIKKWRREGWTSPKIPEIHHRYVQKDMN